MPNLHLPPEILDYIVDFLHSYPNVLQKCCLVSESWIPRARKHLFAEVKINTEENLEMWKKLFSDPSTSPANFAQSLHVRCPRLVTAADAEVGGWLTGFAHIVRLEVKARDLYLGPLAVSLVPFHGFSRTIKSLHVDSIEVPPSEIFDFVLSSPLLEDLTVAGYKTPADDGDDSDGPPTFVHPSNPPVFTGSLQLFLEEAMKPITSRLLSIPGGIHFRSLTLKWNCREDISSTIALVRECSDTLESLDIGCNLYGASTGTCIPTGNLLLFLGDLGSTSVDLSKVTRLEDVTFRTNSPSPKWAIAALRTITPKHRDLRRISISGTYFSTFIRFGNTPVITEQTIGEWSELDRLLAQLWEAYSTPPRIVCRIPPGREKYARDFMGRLLPETTMGGTVNLFYS